MDEVAAVAARVEVTPPPVATITVTLRRTKSAASGRHGLTSVAKSDRAVSHQALPSSVAKNFRRSM
jgi:hypothetical protein